MAKKCLQSKRTSMSYVNTIANTTTLSDSKKSSTVNMTIVENQNYPYNMFDSSPSIEKLGPPYSSVKMVLNPIKKTK